MATNQKKLMKFWCEPETCNLTQGEAVEALKEDGKEPELACASIQRRLEMLPERRLSSYLHTNLILNRIWDILDKLGWDRVDYYGECCAKVQARLIINELYRREIINNNTPISILLQSGYDCTRNESFRKFREYLMKVVAIRNQIKE